MMKSTTREEKVKKLKEDLKKFHEDRKKRRLERNPKIKF